MANSVCAECGVDIDTGSLCDDCIEYEQDDLGEDLPDDVNFFKEKNDNYQNHSTCNICYGLGRILHAQGELFCSHCHGTGEFPVEDNHETRDGEKCPECEEDLNGIKSENMNSYKKIANDNHDDFAIATTRSTNRHGVGKSINKSKHLKNKIGKKKDAEFDFKNQDLDESMRDEEADELRASGICPDCGHDMTRQMGSGGGFVCKNCNERGREQDDFMENDELLTKEDDSDENNWRDSKSYKKEDAPEDNWRDSKSYKKEPKDERLQERDMEKDSYSHQYTSLDCDCTEECATGVDCICGCEACALDKPAGDLDGYDRVRGSREDNLRNESFAFDKFIDNTILKERRQIKIHVEDTPQRTYNKRYRELSQNRIKFSGDDK